MRRAAVLASIVTLAGALPALAQNGPQTGSAGGGRGGYANPAAIIAAEIEVSRMAREKGELAAIRDTAAVNAIVFAPRRMAVRDMLKSKAAASASALAPAALQPSEVWSSCDGSYAIARGSWQRGTAGGSFVTLWQRQPKGGYKWLLDLKRAAPPAASASDMIAGNVAPCRGTVDRGLPRGKKQPILQPTIDPANGHSDDGSLHWTATIDASGAGSFVANTTGADDREVLRVPLAPVG